MPRGQQAAPRPASPAASKALEEARQNLKAATEIAEAVSKATTLSAAVDAALASVRQAFGFDYGSYWSHDPALNALVFRQEHGAVSEDFRRATQEAHFREGQGLNGRAWRERALQIVEDLSLVADCPRAPAAARAGVKLGISLPILLGEQVRGTLDFFALERRALSEERLMTLRAVARTISSAVARFDEIDKAAEAATNASAANKVFAALGTAETFEAAISAALDEVRSAFDWAYGSYWVLDASEDALRFAQESGTVNDEFRRATLSARFREGVGLSGRAWAARDLYFVPDIGEVKDCVRAPAAQRAGVKSGVCFPILLEGKVVGTMDFFTTRVLCLSPERMETLRAVGRLVSSVLAKTRRDSERQSRLEAAVNTASTALMQVDRQHVITWVNEATRRLFARREAEMRAAHGPFAVDRLVGGGLELLYANTAEQRRLLEDPARLPTTARVSFGRVTFETTVSAIVNGRGEHLGNVIEWQDVTDELQARSEIEALITKASVGELRERLDASQYHGFLAALGEGVNNLLDAVTAPVLRTTEVVSALADGDLTQEIEGEFSGEFAVLAGALNRSMRSLREMMAEIREAATGISGAAAELSDGSRSLSERTQEQASSLEETAATVEELTATVKRNAESAGHADDLAGAARKVAEKGGKVVADVVAAMGDISRASKQISEIITVIDEIAFQTNLLALNAAVEAARAGDQGRGFAVVAGEVRNLAQRSAAAAKEIKALIKASSEQVELGSRRAGQSGTTLEEIVGGVRQVSEVIAEIASASAQQAAGIEQVNQALTMMDKVTQENAALVEESASTSSTMDEHAKEMLEKVSFFLIEEAEPEPEPQPMRRARGAQRNTKLEIPRSRERAPADRGRPPERKPEPERKPGPQQRPLRARGSARDGWEAF